MDAEDPEGGQNDTGFWGYADLFAMSAFLAPAPRAASEADDLPEPAADKAA